MIRCVELESEGGFEIGMEIVPKADFSGFRVTEIPCVWMERDKGKSRFKIIQWAPNYLRVFLCLEKGYAQQPEHMILDL